MLSSAELETAFWPKIARTEACWLWTGAVTRSGGQVNLQRAGGRTRLLARRVSWWVHHDEEPAQLLDADCDLACVHPDHLRLVTSLGQKAQSQRQRAERFWSRVDSRGDQCWPWTASCFPNGYGQFAGQGAHRVAWELTHGSIPPDVYVCHACDNPICCRPSHLFPGTAQDNSDDMKRKQRQARPQGPDAAPSKLTNEQVRQMRALYVPRKFGYRAVGELFGVTAMSAYYAVNGRSYREA